MPEPKIYAFIIDARKEAKIKRRIMQILRRRIKKVPNALRQAQLHKMIGCSLRAAYFGHLLETMQVEQLIMKDNHGLWALWDAPRNVAQREWWEQCERKWEECEIAWANSPYGQAEKARREAERNRLIQERFYERLRDFLVENEEELFEFVQRLYFAHTPMNLKHSVHTNHVSRANGAGLRLRTLT